MLTILYAPHMTSTDNEAGRASGHADVPLSEAGRDRARALGRQFAREALAAVYPSDLQRATVTAEIAFAGRDVPIIPDNRLREYDYGAMTRHPVKAVETEFPRRIHEPFPGGESLAMVVARVGDFLRDVTPRHDAQTVVVIGHRATRWALEYWCGDATLEEIVAAPWQWRDVPIWRYALDAERLRGR